MIHKNIVTVDIVIRMEKNDVDTILRSLPEVKKMLNLTNQFLKILLDYRVFSKEMIEDILVSGFLFIYLRGI